MCNNCEPQSIDCYYLLLRFWGILAWSGSGRAWCETDWVLMWVFNRWRNG